MCLFILKINLLLLLNKSFNNYNFLTISQVTWLGADISFPYILFKYNILQKYPMPSLKKLVVTGAPFLKKIQETVAKMMPHTQILNCYGKNQIIKSAERLFGNQNVVIFKKNMERVL